jgi:hypothetical protein
MSKPITCKSAKLWFGQDRKSLLVAQNSAW